MSRRGRTSMAVATALAANAISGPAWAKTKTRLVYERAPDASVCPDEATLRSAVTTRLGYDPFADDASAVVRARVGRTKTGLEGSVEYLDEAHGSQGPRKLSSTGGDCTELSSAIALTITILLDPRAFSGAVGDASAPAPPPPPDPHDSPFTTPTATLSPASADAPRAPTEPLPAPAEPLRFRLGGAVLGSTGTAPAPAVGFAASIGLGRAVWSGDLEARLDLPASVEHENGRGVRSSLVLGSLVPCRHVGVVALCALVSGGVLRGEGLGVGSPNRDASFYAAAGARLILESPISKALSIRAAVDAEVSFTQVTLRTLGEEMWTSPPVFGVLSLGLLGTF